MPAVMVNYRAHESGQGIHTARPKLGVDTDWNLSYILYDISREGGMLSIRLEDELDRLLRRTAKAQGRTMSEVVKASLRDYCQRALREQAANPSHSRCRRASGHLHPGSRRLQDLSPRPRQALPSPPGPPGIADSY
jgi:hypothetical protein